MLMNGSTMSDIVKSDLNTQNKKITFSNKIVIVALTLLAATFVCFSYMMYPFHDARTHTVQAEVTQHDTMQHKTSAHHNPQVSNQDRVILTSFGKVQNSHVCMNNNMHLGVTQLSVVIEGNTYYACCANCTTTLKMYPEERSAIDPISGNKVNKANAVIGADKVGKVFYFENEDNFNKFEPK